MNGRTEGARELVLAVFRLAVADYLGRSYTHDGMGPTRRVTPRFRADAEVFLRSWWAVCLADSIGMEASTIWAETIRLDTQEILASDRAA